MIDELMEKLLEEPVVDNNEIVFTSRAVELIHEISEKCKGIQIVEQTREQAEEYAKDLSAEEVYYDMLRKIVDAPTTKSTLLGFPFAAHGSILTSLAQYFPNPPNLSDTRRFPRNSVVFFLSITIPFLSACDQ